MLTYYDFTALMSGADFPIMSPGRYFRYYSGDAGGMDTRVVVSCDARSISAVLKPGQAIRIDEADKSPALWRVSNYAMEANIKGFVVIGDGSIDDSTIAGDVNVLDGGLARTMANQAFLGNSSVGPIAAQLPHVQLWNPVGSGKNIFVESYSCSSTVAQSIQIGDSSAAYGTVGNAVMSKKGGAAVGVGLMKTTTNAVIQTTNGGPAFYVNANTPQIVNLREPYMIPPGRGLTIFGNTVNTWISANLEWYEKAI